MKINYLKSGVFLYLWLSVGSVNAQKSLQSTSPLSSGLKPIEVTTVEPQVPERMELPGFPEYVNTGKTDADRLRFETLKLQWIAENKGVYDAYMASQNSANETPAQPPYVFINELPGFPVMQRTGNPEADLQRYNAEKIKFYEDNRNLIIIINEQNARLNTGTKSTKN